MYVYTKFIYLYDDMLYYVIIHVCTKTSDHVCLSLCIFVLPATTPIRNLDKVHIKLCMLPNLNDMASHLVHQVSVVLNPLKPDEEAHWT